MIITNGKVISWIEGSEISSSQAILIQEGKIVKVGDQQQLLLENPEDEVLDANGQYVMPGNICAHTHFYGLFSRGMAIPGPAPKDFPEILEKLWWPLDRALQPDDIEYSALACIADAIKHGTTTVFDHHASFGAIEGSLDSILSAVSKSGIRASLCYEASDRDGELKAMESLRENSRFINVVYSQSHQNHLVSAMFGLHASLSLSTRTLELAREMNPDGVGFHIHVAEHSVDEYDSLQKYGMRVVDRLAKHGILGNKTIIAHGVHIDAREIDLLAQTGTWVAHQPRSNMNNAVGMSDVASMLRMGCKVVLGNDGFSNAMWDEWRTTYLAHKLWHLDPRWMDGAALKSIAIDQNAALASQQFGVDIGYIRPGAQADLIFVDYAPITPMHMGNIPWHILFGFRDSMVTMTMVAGNVLMKDRKLLTLNESDINQRTQELVPAVWERYNAQF